MRHRDATWLARIVSLASIGRSRGGAVDGAVVEGFTFDDAVIAAASRCVLAMSNPSLTALHTGQRATLARMELSSMLHDERGHTLNRATLAGQRVAKPEDSRHGDGVQAETRVRFVQSWSKMASKYLATSASQMMSPASRLRSVPSADQFWLLTMATLLSTMMPLL